MPCFTLLLSGLPQHVSLPDLSLNLDRLFNTDDIRTFTLRDLPNHSKTNRRQIALDFASSFDAMIAQDKLDGYQYELDDGRQYTLRAKLNKSEEYMRSDSRSLERCGNSWYGGYGDWIALSLPSVDQQMYHRVHERLDAQLELLEKQKMVIEKEKEILREKQKLKQDYGSMVSSFCQYEVPSRLWMQEFGNGQYFKNTYDESEPVSSSRRSRSGSKEQRSRSGDRHRRARRKSLLSVSRRSRSGSKEQRSRSRDRHRRSRDRSLLSVSRRSRSGSKEQRLRSRDRHRRSRDRSLLSVSRRSRSGSKEQRSRSRDRHRRSRHRSDRVLPIDAPDRRSKSHCYLQSSPESSHRDRPSRDVHKNRRSRYERRSPSVHHRERSASRDRHRAVKDLSVGSLKEKRSKNRRSREKRLRSRSREPMSRERSRSRDRIIYDREQHFRRSRSVEKKNTLLAIMPKSPEAIKPPGIRPTVSYLDDLTSAQTEFVKETRIKIEKDDTKLDTEVTNTKSKKTDKKRNRDTETNLSKEEKRIAKFNRKIRNREKLEARVKEFSYDVMVLIVISLDQLIEKENVKISASNKVQLIKELKKMVQERVEPLAKKRKNSDVKVLRKYKKLYPKEDDIRMIKERLDKIPKLESEPRVTATVSSEDLQQYRTDPIICEVEDDAEQQDLTNDFTPLDVINEIKPEVKEDVDDKKSVIEIKQEKKKEAIIIDIDSPNKPVPKNPLFVVVVTHLLKNMKKVIVAQKLGSKIGITQLTYVLRQILKQMLKGHGFTPRQEIISKFRALYPIEDDENFVRNVIKDINEGKYPRLYSPHVDNTEEDRPDDVVVVEKQYDVVTLADSDEEDRPDDVVVVEKQYDVVTPANSDGTEKEEAAKILYNSQIEKAKEQDSKYLKVTAITIMTSLEELLAKAANKKPDERVDNIKEEILSVPDSAPRVTAITINTSEAELFSIGREDREEDKGPLPLSSSLSSLPIKQEEDDAEANLLNDIQDDINNYSFWF